MPPADRPGTPEDTSANATPFVRPLARRTLLLGTLGLGVPFAESSFASPSVVPFGSSVSSSSRDPAGGSGAAVPSKRVALVIANQEYEKGPLPNIHSDARLMESVLRKLGFDVVVGLDCTRSGMLSLLRSLKDRVAPEGVVFFYYSGHGAQVRGENYLVPVRNGHIESGADLPDECVPLSRVLEAVGNSEGRLGVVVLDACRDNPFSATKSAGSDKGLALVRRGSAGTLVAFAAGPGEVASANPGGRNSLYTEELARNIARPGLRLEDVFLATRKSVRERSGGKQVPQEYGSLESVVHLAGDPEDSPVEDLGKGDSAASSTAASTEIRLDLKGLPPGSRAVVDGLVLVGATFTDETVDRRRTVSLEVTAPGHKPYSARVELSRGKSVVHEVAMEKEVVVLRVVRGLSDVPALQSYVSGLRPIPSGTFLMGSLSGQPNERPRHKVTLSAFRLGATPATVAMWKEYCSATGLPMPKAPPWGWLDDHPMVNVSWNDIMGSDGKGGFCKWASDVSGLALTLPTEAQWEYAARGGFEGRQFPWGDEFDRSKLWCSEKMAGDAKRTASVSRTAQIYRNVYGLTDMAGNVWQWCWDRYGPYGSGSETDPTDPASGGIRCLRGGSWYDFYPDVFRCALRLRNPPVNRYDSYGFRLAADQELRSNPAHSCAIFTAVCNACAGT